MSVKGEKYTSKKAMMKHETTESPAMRKKEYGSAKGGMFASAKKSSPKKMGKKK